MSHAMNLKELERKAFTSYYQDGIWDMYLGVLLMIMPFSGFLTDLGAPKKVGILAHLFLTFGACVSFILVKKYIAAPRLGHVEFNQARKARNIHLRYILAVTATIGIIVFSLIALSPGYRIPGIIDVFSNKMLTGIGIGLFFVVVFSIMAFLMDFTRAYAMGTVFGAGVASAMIFDTAVFMVIGGLVFVIFGSVLFARFLKENPLISENSGINSALPDGKY